MQRNAGFLSGVSAGPKCRMQIAVKPLVLFQGRNTGSDQLSQANRQGFGNYEPFAYIILDNARRYLSGDNTTGGNS